MDIKMADGNRATPEDRSVSLKAKVEPPKKFLSLRPNKGRNKGRVSERKERNIQNANC